MPLEARSMITFGSISLRSSISRLAHAPARSQSHLGCHQVCQTPRDAQRQPACLYAPVVVRNALFCPLPELAGYAELPNHALGYEFAQLVLLDVIRLAQNSGICCLRFSEPVRYDGVLLRH